MKTRLRQVLDRCLNGRDIAIWGNPSRLMLRELKGYKYHIANCIDPQKHYVIAVNYDDYRDFIMDEQSKQFKYIDDYVTNVNGEGLPFEWINFNTKIGKQTYFGDDVHCACEDGYIESIGHFTSIHHNAVIAVNHQLDMSFTSNDIEDFFTEENAAMFQKKLCSDSKHPYARSKNPMTIGNDVYIGANSFINASRVTSIGDGAVIGSGAVVLDDVPPYAIVIGVPAKIKRYRFTPEMIEILLRIKWWDWSVEEINKNADALISPDLFMTRFGNR